jgi:hypothetical protein
MTGAGSLALLGLLTVMSGVGLYRVTSIFLAADRRTKGGSQD